MTLRPRLALVLVASAVIAQTAPPLKFEVISIKLRPPAPRMMTIPNGEFDGIKGNTYTAELADVGGLIMAAYNVKPFQILNLPRSADLFDITAKVEGDHTPAVAEVRQMLQSLLADRFQLRLHREMRSIPVYALVAGKGGLKLKRDERGLTMEGASAVAGMTADRPVIDKTGLDGRYKLETLDLAGIRRSQGAWNDGAPVISIFTEVEDKWGLRLEPQNGPIEVLVVEHVERPSSN